MSLNSAQVRQLKRVLKVTSAPLGFRDFNQFAEGLITPLVELLHGLGGNLYLTDLRLQQDPLFLWHTYDTKLIPEYQSSFFKLSPIHPAVEQGFRVGDIGDFVDYREFVKTPFYNEFLAPRKIHYMAALAAPIPELNQVAALGVHRTRRQPKFSEDEVQLLDLLFTPLQSALRTLQLAGKDEDRFERALGSLPIGILILDWKLRPVYRNRALRMWLAGGDLTVAELELVRRAARAVQGLFVGRQEPVFDAGRCLARLPRLSGSFTVRASVLPEGFIGVRPHVLASFEREAGAAYRVDGVEMEPGLGLTGRETEVAERCVKGETNLEIARSLQISPETVKHHLKQIFSKLGVDRRSQLIHAVSGRSQRAP